MVGAVQVGTTEWDALNEERATLIYKKNRQGLGSDERRRFEFLQQIVRDAIDRTFPAPSLFPAKGQVIRVREAGAD